MANNLKVGYSRVNITPPMGIHIAGYYKERIADGVLDELEACAVAVNDGKNTAVLISLDHCGLNKVFLNEWRANISAATGIDAEAIYIHATHTHTGARLVKNPSNPLISQYETFVATRVVDVAKFAIEDMSDAKMGIGIGEAKNVAFIPYSSKISKITRVCLGCGPSSKVKAILLLSFLQL